MSKKDNIEKFFKKRLSREDHPYSEKHWNEMEKLLDKEGLKPVPFWRSYFNIGIIALAVILSFLGGWYGHRWFTDPITEKDYSIREQGGSVDDPLSNTESLIDSEKKELSDGEDPVEDEPLPEDRSTSENNIAPGESRTSSEIRNTDDESITQRTEADKGSAKTSDAVVIDDSADPSILKKEVLDTVYTLQRIQHLPIRLPQYVFSDSMYMRDILYFELDEEGEEDLQGQKGTFWLGGNFAPDLNSTGILKEKKLSGNFGITLYYELTDRLGINAGITYAKKNYIAEGTEYIPPKGYWIRKTNSIIPDNITGQCGILDIPINVSYKLNPLDRFIIIPTLGISSYILLDEDYQFIFNDPNPGAQAGWATDNNSSILFGYGNLMVSVNYRINNRLELILSPYYKIPIKKLGFGNINLHSSGSHFGFRYRLN